MKHNINQSLPWIVCEPHARMHGMSNGTVVATPHQTAVRRFATESDAVAYLTGCNVFDERLARLGSVNPNRSSKRFIAYSTATYADIIADMRESSQIDAMVDTVIAMTR